MGDERASRRAAGAGVTIALEHLGPEVALLAAVTIA
jgi:hypothetical protein